MITEQLLSEKHRFREDFVPDWLTQSQSDARKLFLDKVHNKNRYLSIAECPYCGNDNFIKISEVNKRGLPSDIVICSSCDGCFKSEILDSEATRFYYEKISPVFRRKDLPDDEIDSLFEKRVRLFAYPRYHFISHFVKLKPGKDLVMEFGCDDGANLVPWKRMGYDVFGIDLNPTIIKFGRDKGLDLVCGDFMNYNFSDKTPRLIILSHVLGHVIDVNTILKRIYDILTPGGYVFIETPGIRSWKLANIIRFFDVECNYYFDLNSLGRVLKAHSFEIVYGDEYVRVLCTPKRNQPVSGHKPIPPSLSKITAHFLMRIIDMMNLRDKKLYDLLKDGERGKWSIIIFNKLQKLYFYSFYNSLTKKR